MKLTDYVVGVLITGVEPMENHHPYQTEGPMLVTYNAGPQSRFAIRPSTTKKKIKDAVMFCARGKVLDAIEAKQRSNDGEPTWLLDAMYEATKSKEVKEARDKMLAWQAANPLR